MSESLRDIEALIEGLKQQRDAIKVQLHLGKVEVKQEWEEMENKLEQLRAKVKLVQGEAEAASRDVFEAAKLLGEEIMQGYERIRKRL